MKWREFLENWLVTYLMVVILGGMVSAQRTVFAGNLPFFFSAVLSAGGLWVTTWYLGKRKQFANQLFRVEIHHRGQVCTLMGYWDSGNLLRDPYNGKPVCILSKSAAAKLIDAKKDFIRFIPYLSLGQTDGLLPVVSMEAMNVYEGQNVIQIKPAEVGIAQEGLLEKKEYDMILHASLLGNQERGMVNGRKIRNAKI